MRASPDAYALIRDFESLELEAYPDPHSDLGDACAVRGLPMREYRQVPGWEGLKGTPWTIGWGHTRGVREGDECSPTQADVWLHEDVGVAERVVIGLTAELALTQCQFDALVSFAFNVPPDEFAGSTLLRLLRDGHVNGAADQFLRWKFSNGKPSKGLLRRRERERALFLRRSA